MDIISKVMYEQYAVSLVISSSLYVLGIYDPDFIAANQEERADNLVKGSKSEQVQAIRRDIQAFKAKNNLDKIVILWTANTERYSQVGRGYEKSEG